jgi:hypothetical protein
MSQIKRLEEFHMMKKLLALLFAVCLTMSFACAQETDTHSFTPTLCNVLDRSVDEWYETSTNRALLAGCILLDFPSKEREDMWEELSSGFALNNVYVAKDEEQLNVYFFGKGKVMLVVYDPASGLMLTGILGDAIDTHTGFLDYLLADGNIESYYHSDSDDIMMMIDIVIDVLSEE